MNNKGINLIALVIMIIIMIIIAAIAYSNSFDAHEKALIAREKEENMNVTNAIQNRFGEYMVNNTLNPLCGVIIPANTKETMNAYIINYLREHDKLSTERRLEYESAIFDLLKQNEENLEYTRILERSHLVELGIENIPTDAMYVVNYYGTTVVGPIY